MDVGNQHYLVSCLETTLLAVEVILDGKAISEYKPKEFARKLAVVHQQNEAPADITVEKLISFGRMPYKNIFSPQTDEDREAIERALVCTIYKVSVISQFMLYLVERGSLDTQ